MISTVLTIVTAGVHGNKGPLEGRVVLVYSVESLLHSLCRRHPTSHALDHVEPAGIVTTMICPFTGKISSS